MGLGPIPDPIGPEQKISSEQEVCWEKNVIQQNPLLARLANGLEQRDVKAQRRALRLPIEALSWEWQDKDNKQTLVLSFTLTTGSFATSVLASLVKQLIH